MGTNFTRPTVAEIITRVGADIEGALEGVTAKLRRTVEYALTRAIAGVSHSLHGHLAWVAEQILPDQASDAFVVRFAGLFGVNRTPAVVAAGSITVTGTGGDMPAGTEWVRLADGAVFATDAEELNIASATVAVTAVVAGADGNMDEGDELVLASPITDVDSTAEVAAGGIVDGADVESIPALVDRLVDRIQDPPMGGKPGDHVTWAKEVSGVTRAWEYKGTDGNGNPGLGKVTVTFVCDDLGSIGDPSGIIPSGGKVAEVLAYLQDLSPAEVIVFAPTAVPLDLDITLAPNTVAVQDAVEAEIYDMLAREAEPGGILYLSRIREAISAATGETQHDLTSPVVDDERAFGEIAILGTLTFSAYP
jgi:uncharacterized phage protein gp47/JayE